MCEETEINYLDGEVVWVKLGSCWWPGEVVATEKLPPDVMPSFRKPPIAVVKFFQEDAYEYVKNLSSIDKYNCIRKNEFINKGLYMYRTKHGHMEKFPEDVIRAETAVGGDIKILTRDEFQETKKESYAGLFGNPGKKTPASGKKGKSGHSRSSDLSSLSTPIRKLKEKTNYKVHILVQGSKNTPSQNSENVSTPSTSRAGSEPTDEKSGNIEESTNIENSTNVEDKSRNTYQPTSVPSIGTPATSTPGIYACHACAFSTTRLNVLILHNKTHSVTFMPYTPSPVKKKPVKTPKTTPKSSKPSKPPKQRKPPQENAEKANKKSQNKKRVAEEPSVIVEVKKTKTDEEIKSSLLADWDDMDEDSNDESSAMVMAGSPEVPMAAESPAVPTPAEISSVPVPGEISIDMQKKPEISLPAEKPESSDDSKYEFCEDEDWPVEADAGRKIPRVKNPSQKKDDSKSISLDEDEVAREVAELLNKTAVPELPSVPETLKVEENFPEPSIIKSPDKKSENSTESAEKNVVPDSQPPKTIFKTKTFFRSRHSRSQDAIGKYVAEQLNAAERLDNLESDINGLESISSPEPRVSPLPVEPVKVTRLAPKIQLKKMKAEAAQLLRAKEKYITENVKIHQINDSTSKSQHLLSDSLKLQLLSSDSSSKSQHVISVSEDSIDEKEEAENQIQDEQQTVQNVIVTNNVTVEDVVDKENIKLKSHSEVVEVTVEENIENTKELHCIATNEDVPEPIETTVIIETETITPHNVSIESSISYQGEETISQNIVTDSDACKSTNNTFMNESTASAVDALLSVSRETDRVTRVISDDPPEDLFEDDNKDSGSIHTINGFDDVANKSDDKNEVQEIEIDSVENTELQNNINNLSSMEYTEHKSSSTSYNDVSTPGEKEKCEPLNILETISQSRPTESDLQIAEALINLPSTTIQNKLSGEQLQKSSILPTPPIEEVKESNRLPEISTQNKFELSPTITNTENINIRFETEQEKSENLNAAQSLVQMSETIDHKINVNDSNSTKKQDTSVNNIFKTTKENDGINSNNTVEQNLTALSIETNNEAPTVKNMQFATSSSKLLKILEEPCLPKVTSNKAVVTKKVIVPGKEKILNFDVAKSPIIKGKPKQKIIIRRAPNKNLLNTLSEAVCSPDKIILSRNNKGVQDDSVQTYTIQTTVDKPKDANTIVIQPKLRKVTKPPTKLQKIKPQPPLVTSVREITPLSETSHTDDAMFDINAMPIVLSDDILTPESIEKMPIVMSDGNIIANSPNTSKHIKPKQTIVVNEKVPVTSGPSKPEMKTLLVGSSDLNKVTTPNILSKSSKLRGAKPMLVIDKTTGKQKIIMTKTESTVKEVKQTQPKLIQSVPQTASKTEKFIILPTTNSPRPNRTQKIVIDPQTGKAHVLVKKSQETPLTIPDNKPVSAKLIPSISDSSTPGNTVMIITNAQGAQSRIVLTPEHEKILFPNKQQPVSQLKTITHRISSNTAPLKTIVTSVSAVRTQTRIVPKQKSAIITSKGQLIVGGRVATTAQNIAPLPEIRPAPKRIVTSEPKKNMQTVQTVQNNTPTEPLVFIQQKPGTVMQLTAAQFEHLQRTGQIVQKPTQENKIVVQKSITISPNEPVTSVPKSRARRLAVETPTPTKKQKLQIPIAPAPVPPPAPAPAIQMPHLTPLPNTAAAPLITTVSNPGPISTTSYDLDNFEELLPSTAIARQPEQTVFTQSDPGPLLADGQILAISGENFGGPPGSFYLCMKDNGTLTPIDNRPLMLENNQLVPMPELPTVAALAPQPERRDILEAALANVFHGEPSRDEAPDFRDLNANVSVHCRVSETSTTLHQPIMTPVEVPSKVDSEPTTVPSNLEDGLAVIGVTPQTVPTSLELPITVTDPRIAPKTTDPLSNNNYGTAHPLLPSPNTEMTYVSAEETDLSVVGPISMPLLTEEESVGKSMPILTDEISERNISSVESTIASPSSTEVRESETEDSGQWPRRLLTPCSDTSEMSVEIPLQPAIQFSVNDLSRNS